MKITRRELVSTSLAAIAISLTGCLSTAGQFGPGSSGPHVDFSGNVSTDEPLTASTDISPERAYPRHYSELITTKEEEETKIRWEYIERDIPLLVDDLQGTDFDSAYLIFFGMVLPETKQLHPGSLTLEDGTLHSSYRIGRRSSAARGLTINTYLRRVESGRKPDDVKFSVTF